jgi:hypothetical protein
VAVDALEGIRAAQLRPVHLGKAWKASNASSASSSWRQPWARKAPALDHLAHALACLLAALGLKEFARRRRRARAGRVGTVHRATLPGAGHAALDRVLQALVLV